MATASVAGSPLVDRWYDIATALTIITVVVGFAPSLVHTAGRKAPITRRVAAHSIVNLAWLLVVGQFEEEP